MIDRIIQEWHHFNLFLGIECFIAGFLIGALAMMIEDRWLNNKR